MAIDRGTFWDRLPLRYKGALIVGAPITALLLTALTSFWFDRQNDRTDTLVDKAQSAYMLIDHVRQEIAGTATALQRYTLTEDPDTLPRLDTATLNDLRALGELRHPVTGEPYPAVASTSATVRELLLSAQVLSREASQQSEPSERREDALDLISERVSAQSDQLEMASTQTERDASEFERDLAAIEDREEAADAVTLLVGLLGGLAAAAFFARNFTTRISALGTAAEHLAAGDFSRPFPHGSDEIGILAERVFDAFSALRSSEERSQLILETSADGYTAVDESWTVTAWNRSAEEIFGWSKSEAVGRSLLELVVPEDQHALHKADLERYISEGRSGVLNERIETTALRKDGTVIPIDLSVVPIRTGDGLTLHGFIRDLTERKQAEEDVAHRALRMAEIIQTMSQMASADLDVRLLHDLLLERAKSLTNADGVALQLEHGGMLNIVTGVGPVAAFVGHKLDIAASMTGRTLRTGETFVTGDVLDEDGVDLRLSREIGTRSAITVPLSDAGRVVGVLAVHSTRVDAFGEAEVTDLEILGGFFGAVISKIQAYVAREVVVRERTNALEELRELHDELAAKNEALVLATEEANAANQAKSDFLSRMSHELRTPLNAILGFAQLLQTEPLDEDQADSVCHIEMAGRHLLALINEVLEIARIESGTTAVSMRPMALAAVVGESLDLIKPLAAERGITVAFAPGAGCDEVWADAQKVKQVMLNLLSNAVKYNRERGSVEVSFVGDDETLSVAVRDTGAGIPEAKTRSLFTPFDRLGAEDTTVEGTGLGLAVSKQLAEAMGGALLLDTSEGSGSTFTLQLRRSEPGFPLSPDGTPPASRGTPARDHLVVVHVEDNASNARLVERALRARPDVVLRVAHTGAAGLELVAQLRPAVVLLDMNLPDLSGVEVLRAIRADDANAAVAVAVVSADATPEQVDAALGAGADAYLTKPLDLAELLATIDRLGTTRRAKVDA